MVAAALPVQLPLDVAIGPLRTTDDAAYVRGSWTEGFKLSPGNREMPWRVYKRHVRPDLVAIMQRADSSALGAYLGDVLVGWILFSRGVRVSTVHWIHTRWRVDRESETLRRRGIMGQLLDAAKLGSRLVYTHKGPWPAHRKSGDVPADEWIVPWLARRGVSAAYVPIEEWLK